MSDDASVPGQPAHPGPARGGRRRFTSPEMLVGLSAVVLSLCGLFIALYEASLMRQEARAAAWPMVEVSTSISPDGFRVWSQNNGVGPARVRDAVLTHHGEPVPSWAGLIRRLGGDTREIPYYQSLLGGRTLPAQSEREQIFRIDARGPDHPAAAIVDSITSGFTRGDLDLVVCFCSVYDDCWTSSLHDMLRRWQGEADVPQAREVEACRARAGSAI